MVTQYNYMYNYLAGQIQWILPHLFIYLFFYVGSGLLYFMVHIFKPVYQHYTQSFVSTYPRLQALPMQFPVTCSTVNCILQATM